MNTAAHPIAPEEIMAFLDGELPHAQAQLVSAHLDHCAECASIAEQFRATSELLARWTVPPGPLNVPDLKTEKTSRVSFWNWRWTVGSGSVLATALVLLVIVSAPKHKAMRYYRDEMAISKKSEHLDEPRIAASLSPSPPPSKLAFTVTQQASAADHSAPMIARTVSLTIQVKDFAESRVALDAILARHHGYAARLEVETPENSGPALQASLRIPAPDLTAAMVELKTIGRVEQESQSGEEVTQEHADLAARLQNSRETEARLRGILEQRTGKIEDVLQVEEEIARVRGEIEQMESEQKALEHRVDFSSVELHLTEEYKATLDTPAESASTSLHNAFVAGYRHAADTVLRIVLFFAEFAPTILLWLAILGFPAVLLWRRHRRSRGRL
jgi:hypothetical protein